MTGRLRLEDKPARRPHESRRWRTVIRRPAVVAITLAFVVGVAGGATAQDPTRVRIATEGAYPPWNATDGSGRLVGFEIDLAGDLCTRMKVECEMVTRAWEGIVEGLLAGRYDAIMSGLKVTPERREAIGFSTPYATMPARFAVRRDGALAGHRSALDRIDLDHVDAAGQAALDELKQAFSGRRVGVEVASASARFATALLDDAVEIRRYVSEDEMALDLWAGRIELALAGIGYWQPLLEGDQGRDLTLIGPGLSGGPFGSGIGVGLRKSDDQLRAMFDQAIAAATADGTLARLSREWFGLDASP